MNTQIEVVEVNWSGPKNVRAFTTTRRGGVSCPPYKGLNLGAHVGDDLGLVNQNRSELLSQLQMPDTLIWLNQTHSTQVAYLPAKVYSESDAAFTSSPNQICAVLTADCLPVVFTNRSGTQVAVAHAGWRGLCNGVLEETVSQFKKDDPVIAWLGPAIGPEAFEVGEEVRAAFIEKMTSAEGAFKASKNTGKWLGNLYELARQRLQACGVFEIYGGDHCTFTEEDQFYSYRRDGVTGRMATLVWFEPSSDLS
ncbi:peptidoglycan editing factor PgeF [Marinomonas balearica]|uniref:Purine nucleoside phosphorylase n=1 Tax=Marinomonas balearica TaxID=491947 RepID=A0A4R6M5V3_9GAMM|nr:peptidoglycan editing factor PgeF [Marinomonas balearica]TDO96466.1 hypothetical protein DFP79_3041 [Marinomonas balearica]